MARVRTTQDGKVVEQTCNKCGSNNVDCWHWGKNPIIEYNNKMHKQNKSNKIKQRWDCWRCKGYSGGFSYADEDVGRGRGEWVCLEY